MDSKSQAEKRQLEIVDSTKLWQLRVHGTRNHSHGLAQAFSEITRHQQDH